MQSNEIQYCADELVRKIWDLHRKSKDRIVRNNALSLLQKLRDFPPSGGGGAHGALLGVSNHAVRCELEGEEILTLLREVIHGEREIPDAEIWEAIEKAEMDYEEGREIDTVSDRNRKTSSGKVFRSTKISDEHKAKMLALRDEWIKKGKGIREKDILQLSSAKPPKNLTLTQECAWFLAQLYSPEDKIFMGQRCHKGKPGRNIKSTARWCREFREGRINIPELLILNPLSGNEASSKSGKPTYRGDACVLKYKYAVAEHDELSLDDQLAFWYGSPFPLVALIYSGGKSYHAWMKIDGIRDHSGWEQQVEQKLYQQMLVPMGVDPACKNPARLTRMLGHRRRDKNNEMQRCIYIAPEGRRINHGE